MDNGCVLYFMHLGFFLRTELILCFIVVNAEEVSLLLCLLKKRSLVLASNVPATSVYPLLRHFD